MYVLELEFSVLIVVELNLEPARLGVTSITLLAMIPRMSVVHFMTKITIHRGIDITLVRMAVRAGYVFMGFFQLKIGFVMIKPGGFPRFFDVAIFTKLAQPGFVPVVVTMTGNTLLLSFAEL